MENVGVGRYELLTIQQLAERLKTSTSTIRRGMANGLPIVRIGRSIRFEFDEVRDWYKRQCSSQ